MANCTKCGTSVDQPKKTWKIKKTSVALFECPSCKSKWRSKFIETNTFPLAVPATIQAPVREVQTETLEEKIDTEKPMVDAVTAIVQNNNNVDESDKPVSLFSRIRMFFAGP